MTARSALADFLFVRVSLRKGLRLAFGALASLAGLAAVALLVITVVLHENAHKLTGATAREEIARDVETDLLMHNQLSNWALANGSGEIAELVARQKEYIRKHLDDARAFAGTPAEQAVLSNLGGSVDNYFAVREQVESQKVPLAEAVERTGAALALSLRDVRDLQTLRAAT